MMGSNLPAMVAMGIASKRPASRRRGFFGLFGGGGFVPESHEKSVEQEPQDKLVESEIKTEPKESDKLYDTIMVLLNEPKDWKHIGNGKWVHNSGLAIQVIADWFEITAPVEVNRTNFTEEQKRNVAGRLGQIGAQKTMEHLEAYCIIKAAVAKE